MLSRIKNFLLNPGFRLSAIPVVEAYDSWAGSYDHSTGNLMLELDEMIFSELIRPINLKDKKVADIGCGTGRHWQKMYDKDPVLIMGFDVSPGMLNELLLKFPQATTTLTTDNLLKTIPDSYFDCLVTTLTIAHIKNAEEAIGAWSRVLQTGGDLVITDFHPDMLAKGGKRSFKEGNRTLSVINYIHPLAEIKETFAKRGFVLIKEEERKVTETLRSWYERQNALAVYERFKGIPIIYGLHVKKLHAAQ